MRMTKASRSFFKLGIICCAASLLLFFPGLALTRDLDGKYSNRSSSGSKASQAEEGLAAHLLMARALRM
jgi:hypothetical protein